MPPSGEGEGDFRLPSDNLSWHFGVKRKVEMPRLFISSINRFGSPARAWQLLKKRNGLKFLESYFILIARRGFWVETMVSSLETNVVLTVIAMLGLANCQFVERQGGR